VIGAALALALSATPLAQGWGESWDDDAERRRRVLLSAWLGEALGGAGSGRSSTFFGAEAAWAFDSVDLGLAGYGYRRLRDAEDEWTPVALVRVTQRFRTRGGAEAAFGFGVGAGRLERWSAWYQVALGVRVPLGPLFVGGEIAFEQYDLLRLGVGVGVGF
jgi:hypothetical protein